MRTIKFRAKIKENGEWLYGDLEYNRQKDIARIHTYNKDGIYEGQEIIDADTIGQFTGLYDKNGKEIYEGDIMNDTTTKGVGVVEWNSVLCQFQLSWQNMPTAADIFFMVKCGSFVIGNIHDNPELLKGRKR